MTGPGSGDGAAADRETSVALEPVDALPWIRRVDGELVELLRSLDPGDWGRPAVGAWRVRDVAAHLLDGNLRRLSLDRDGHQVPVGELVEGADPGDFDGLVAFLDELNRQWVGAARRLSPRVLVELLEVTNGWVTEHLEGLDPRGNAALPVAWAGQDPSPVWLDTARELTEKWHHQQQIRETVAAPGLEDPELVRPLLETLLRALPPAWEGVEAEPGTVVEVVATDLEGGRWWLVRRAGGWVLRRPVSPGAGARRDGAHVRPAPPPGPAARISAPARPFWRRLLRFRDAPGPEAFQLAGPTRLTEPLFRARGVMAR